MDKHAAEKQRRFVWLWLPWVMVTAGVVGLLLLLSRPREQPQRPEPPTAASQPCTVAAAPVDSQPIPEAASTTIVQPAPQPAVPRFVERISTDSTRRPLGLPLQMAPLDTISSLAPLQPIR